jgi:acyl dehydratase
MNPAHDDPVGLCYFTSDLQKAFCQLSGDYNPIHDDPVAARRTIAGGQVVHGIHLVLATVEIALSRMRQQGSPLRTLTGFNAVFQQPVLVGATVSFHLAEVSFEECRVVVSGHGEIYCQISIRWGSFPAASRGALPALPAESVIELHFNQLEGKTGSLPLGLDAPLAREMFPLATSMLGELGIAEILSLSRLVGMHCPGLHSLFGECTASFHEASGDSRMLEYHVKAIDDRFGKVALQVNGPRLDGKLTCFFRPPFEQQAGMEEVRRRVQSGMFAHSVALIVGGSRGLGEITARVIAAGGGLPIITYHRGTADAERIASEIKAAGNRCNVMQLDVRQSEVFIRELAAAKLAPHSLYYYATPKIFGRRRGFFDHERLREFQEVYVTAFGQLVDALAVMCPATFRVFYPSSIAVTENLRELAEYAIAKRTGEELCAFYNQHAKQIKILVERLPRIRTDQTSTLMPFPAEEGLDVILPLVCRVENF